MAFFTRSLQDLPRITVNDVTRIIQTSCQTSATMKEKGFKLYISSYVRNYEGVSYLFIPLSQSYSALMAFGLFLEIADAGTYKLLPVLTFDLMEVKHMPVV